MIVANDPRGNLLIHVSLACGFLETIAVGLRLLARWKSKAGFGSDDVLIVLTLIPSYGMLVGGILMVTLGGAGYHNDTLSRSKSIAFLKTLDSTLITYMFTIAMSKISILLLYRRIFVTKGFSRATLVIGAAIVTWAIVANFVFIFQCHPVSGMFNPDFTFSNKCINLSTYFSAVSGLNMALDIVVLCLPLWMVWHLKLDSSQKIMLSGVFALGALTCFASLMRIVTVKLLPGSDIPYNMPIPYIWSQIESTMSIICACLITFRPLFRLLPALKFQYPTSLPWTRRSNHVPRSHEEAKGRCSDVSGGGGREHGMQGEKKGSFYCRERENGDVAYAV